MRAAGGLLAAGVALAVLVVTGPAHGETSVTSERFTQLIEDAGSDPEALRRLLEVESVGGKPYDVEAALGGGSADQIRSRLEALTSGTGPAGTIGSPRAEAKKILSHRRFQEPKIPRPLKGPIQWLGGRLRPIGRVIGGWIDALIRKLPGGQVTLWIMLALFVAGLVALLTLRYMSRATRSDAARSHRREKREKAIDLEKAADSAEAAGDWSEAIRLRFRAGLLRLRAAGVVPDDDVIPNGEIVRRLRLSSFSHLAQAFDEVHYGKRRGTPQGAADAKIGWKRLFEQLAVR